MDTSLLGWLGRQASAPKPVQELALTGASSLLLPTDTMSRSLSLRVSIPGIHLRRDTLRSQPLSAMICLRFGIVPEYLFFEQLELTMKRR